MVRTLFAVIGGTVALAGAAEARPDAAAATAAARAKPKPVTATTFLVSGRGWGHGVGMSQYGALGLANEGRSYGEILAHYYTGTELSQAPVGRVRVLVAEAKATLTVSSEQPFRVRDASGVTEELPAGNVELGRLLELDLPTGRRRLEPPLVFLPGKAPLVVGKPYRGQIEVVPAGKKLNAVNALGLEQYLAGVVPDEMPAAWPEEALKAQAVAARSYALAHRVTGREFDLYADVRSQVYGGVEAEDARATKAIQATAGEVVTYEGKIADTLFHSTSGGRTVSAAEAFGATVPYLVSVDDPHSAISPVHSWGPVTVTDVVARKGLKLGTPVTGIRLVKAASGRVGSAVVRTTVGERTVTGGQLRSGLGLRSTWITSFRPLSLTRPGGPVLHGGTITVSADARGIRDVTLLRRVGRSWQEVRRRPGGGRFSLAAKLTEPTAFRLTAGTLRGSVLAVPVAPRVKAARTPGGIAGTVAPAREGAVAQVQRLQGVHWVTVGEARVDATGAFATELSLDRGAYRVRVAPAGGFVQGLSATFDVG
jgi:stage II sporulation protein D